MGDVLETGMEDANNNVDNGPSQGDEAAEQEEQPPPAQSADNDRIQTNCTILKGKMDEEEDLFLVALLSFQLYDFCVKAREEKKLSNSSEGKKQARVLKNGKKQILLVEDITKLESAFVAQLREAAGKFFSDTFPDENNGDDDAMELD